MNKLYIMCAFPGAGKGFWIDNNIPNAKVCSADHFFVGDDGVYRFNPGKLHAAHTSCQIKAHAFMKAGEAEVVIDNTNLATWQMQKYLDTAKEFGYEVEIIRITANPDVAFKRQQHGVPKDGHDRMVQQFLKRDLPEGIAVREVAN